MQRKPLAVFLVALVIVGVCVVIFSARTEEQSPLTLLAKHSKANERWQIGQSAENRGPVFGAGSSATLITLPWSLVDYIFYLLVTIPPEYSNTAGVCAHIEAKVVDTSNGEIVRHYSGKVPRQKMPPRTPGYLERAPPMAYYELEGMTDPPLHRGTYLVLIRMTTMADTPDVLVQPVFGATK